MPFLCALLLVIIASNDATPSVKKFEARYRSARTIRAAFIERYAENGRTIRTESGTAYFQRPGKMRWEYELPDKSLFVVDGKTAWFYVPADHTVTRVPARESGDWRTPLALLAGEAKLSRVCASIKLVESAVGEVADRAVFRCTFRGQKAARPDRQAPDGGASDGKDGRFAILEVDRATGELRRVIVNEGAGIEVEFQFTNWQFNPPLAEGLFRFQPSTGVAIVDGELPAGGRISKR